MAEKLAYRPAEACAVTGLGRSHLYELMASGDIASFKVGRARLISAEALVAFIRRRETGEAS